MDAHCFGKRRDSNSICNVLSAPKSSKNMRSSIKDVSNLQGPRGNVHKIYLLIGTKWDMGVSKHRNKMRKYFMETPKRSKNSGVGCCMRKSDNRFLCRESGNWDKCHFKRIID